MGHVNTDNPKPHKPSTGESAAPSPAPPSGSLEDRIDSLLSEMQESLDDLEGPDHGAPSPPVPVETAAKEEASGDGATLEAGVDEAIRQASEAVGAGETRNEKAVSAVPDPMAAFDDAGEGSATSEGAPPSESIEALDEQLARQAESLGEDEPEAAPEPTPSGVEERVEPEAIVDRGGPSDATEGVVDKGGEHAAPEASGEPADEPDTPAPESRSKRKIPAIKRKGGGAATEKQEDSAEASAPVAASAPEASEALVAPSASAHEAEGSGGVVRGVLEAMAKPLMFVPPQVRDYIGWFGLLTAFNAVCVWLFWVLLRA